MSFQTTTSDSVAPTTTAAAWPGLRQWQVHYARWLMSSDAVIVIGVVALAQVLRFGDLTATSLVGLGSIDYILVSASIAALWIAALTVHRTRSTQILGSGIEEYRRVWMATLSVFGVIAVASILLRIEIARGYLAIAFPLGLLALTMSRWLSRRFVVRHRRRGAFMHTVLAVGRPESVRALAKSLARAPGDGYRLVAVCVPGLMARQSLDLSPSGPVPAYPYDSDIATAVAMSGADTVVLTSGHLDADEIRDLSWQLEKLDVDLVVSPGMADVASPRLTVRLVGGQPLLHVDKPRYDGAKRFQKRAFDVGFALMVLLLTSPVLLAAALAVKAGSRGPVLYRSERIGIDGKPFQMIKFRSMVIDADRRLADIAHLNEGGAMLFKIRRDPRVTSVGRFLRRYSLDELPQFINVLTGEMSVVGPRPPLRTEVEAYDDHVRRRLLVRPGITGLWQVSGRSDLSWEDSVRLDLSYVENWSMLGDLAIAMKTANAIFRATGAY
ncbi:sugar transferase [Mycolicibacterium arseniciresistens]|uniref:Sugar transferase n=1 Tax=Mycolicibacterium arseniciresistens TaxID=3062257 RepID=A0ABT8UKD5_9MYCO|nr:sugar transferase [Mycolicibacterium arseniciresistens]MDO3636838.1 sugar transferase [Mycolicibacterium arseniciresistens]